MKRSLTALLAAGMLLAGCANSESEDDNPKVIRVEEGPPQTVSSSTTAATVPPAETVPTETTSETTVTTTTPEETTTTTTTTSETTTTTTLPPETTTTTTTTTPKPTTTTTTTTTAKRELTAPEAASFSVETGENSTTVSWDKAEGADGYVVMLRRSADSYWEDVADTTELKAVLEGIGRNKAYSFSVKSYMIKDGERVYSDKNEVSAFPYLTQKNGITYVDGMMIVNKTYGLPKSYNPGLSAETQAAFNEMKKGAKADGLDIWICSGFRNYNYQYSLYWGYVNRDGSQASADKYSARPGYSEHQSGLAVDVNQASRYFNGSPVAVWLEKNCWKYGFIIRYPKGKEGITGYNYESWHCRYVGKDKAKMFHENGLTVEEYYGLTSEYTS